MKTSAEHTDAASSSILCTSPRAQSYTFTHIVNLFQKWISIASGALKLCVPSREHNVFEESFESSQKLRLQDLTREDLERYVTSELANLDMVSHNKLPLDIVQTAQGILLWVILVVKTIHEHISDGNDLVSFEKELDALLEELEDLFSHLLRNIAIRQRKKAFIIFAMISSFSAIDRLPSPISFAFLDDVIRDDHFAERKMIAHGGWPWQSTELAKARMDALMTKAQKIVRGCCRALVDIIDPDPDKEKTKNDTHSLDGKYASLLCPSRLNFTHHSMIEFLGRPNAQQIA